MLVDGTGHHIAQPAGLRDSRDRRPDSAIDAGDAADCQVFGGVAKGVRDIAHPILCWRRVELSLAQRLARLENLLIRHVSVRGFLTSQIFGQALRQRVRRQDVTLVLGHAGHDSSLLSCSQRGAGRVDPILLFLDPFGACQHAAGRTKNSVHGDAARPGRHLVGLFGRREWREI